MWNFVESCGNFLTQLWELSQTVKRVMHEEMRRQSFSELRPKTVKEW